MIEKMKSKGNSTFWCLVGIFLTGALPLFTNYCLNSAEVPYQLVRIENMKDYRGEIMEDRYGYSRWQCL